MIIGVPKEIKNHEFRVGLLAEGVASLVRVGHQVIIQRDAGQISGVTNVDYETAGGEIVDLPELVYSQADMIVKVMEPQVAEYKLFKKDQIVFSYFHFALNRPLTEAMLECKITALAYETLQTQTGQFPCLTAASQVAGCMAVQEGAKYLQDPLAGRGILLAGLPGIAPAEVTIIGAGTTGTNACKMAAGLGANVTVLDIDLNRLRYITDIMPGNVHTLMSDTHNIRESVLKADLVILCVLIHGAKAPCLIDRKLLSQMKKGAVIVDLAIGQGGSVETSRPTTPENPTYVVDGVVHYCVANMPGMVPRTGTRALTNTTFSYILQVANDDYKKLIRDSHEIRTALNMTEGHLTIKEVAETFDLPYKKFGL
jgi:alanine dehydrogenase